MKFRKLELFSFHHTNLYTDILEKNEKFLADKSVATNRLS